MLRFTDAAEFAGAPRGPWWPDDVDDFLEQMWDQIDGYWGERVLEAHVATSSPDIQVDAIAVLLSEAPWAAEPNTRAWTLVIRNDGELTVIEYATEQDTTAALMNHVRTREAADERYDYVVDPRQPRTAVPPAQLTG